MSSNRKILKLLSFAQVIVAVVAIVLGVFALTGARGTDEATRYVLGVGLPGSAWSILRAVVLLLLVVSTIAAAFKGIQGANLPRSIGKQGMTAAIGVILGIVCTAVALGLGAPLDAMISALLAVLDLAAAIFGSRVRKELDR